ncbi:hypothetical protein [Pseudomonas sp.]|uniref:hypothetical protein n=1 Tax=Pseudomonas sp. TaxID=306 RepID=UPI003F953584
MEMNTVAPLMYTNEVSPEFLRTLDKSPFTEQQLAEFNEETMSLIHQQQAYCEAHPPLAIYRLATEGSQTRDGGVIQHATTPMEIPLDNGRQVRVAQVGDYVVYADGSTAKIATGAGEGNSHLALVGSQLSNGDAIINTPQGCSLFIARDDVPLAEGFLPSIEG